MGAAPGRDMTYNFDPEQWYDRELAALQALRRSDPALDEAAFQRARDDLDRRYEAMLGRLDGTYHLPKSKD